MKPKLQAEIIIEKFNYGDKTIAKQCATAYIEGMIDEAILHHNAFPTEYATEREKFWREVKNEI